MSLIYCLLKEFLTTSIASNAATAKALFRLVSLNLKSSFRIRTLDFGGFDPSSLSITDEQLLMDGWCPVLQDSFRATL